MNKILTFEFEKETPGTYRYKEIVPDDEESLIATVYIKKIAFENGKPEKLQLLLRFDEPKE